MGVNFTLLTEHNIKNIQDLERFSNLLSRRKLDFLFEFDKGVQLNSNANELEQKQHSVWNVSSPSKSDYYDSLELYWNDPELKCYEINTPDNFIFYLCIYRYILLSPNALRWSQFTQVPEIHHQIRKACFELNREFQKECIYISDSSLEMSDLQDLVYDNPNLRLEQIKHELKQHFGLPAPIGWLMAWDDIVPIEKPRAKNQNEFTGFNNVYYIDDFSDFELLSSQEIIQQIHKIVEYTCLLHNRYSIKIPVKGIISLPDTANVSNKELGSDLKSACDLLNRAELDPDLNKHQIQILTKEKQILNWPRDFR